MTLQHQFQATGARLRQAFVTLVRALSEPVALETDALGRDDGDLVFHVRPRRALRDERREKAWLTGEKEDHDDL